MATHNNNGYDGGRGHNNPLSEGFVVRAYEFSSYADVRPILDSICWDGLFVNLTALQMLALEIEAKRKAYQFTHFTTCYSSDEGRAEQVTELLRPYLTAATITPAYQIIAKMLEKRVLMVTNDNRVLLADRWQSSFVRFVIEMCQPHMQKRLATDPATRWKLAGHLSNFLWTMYADARSPKQSSRESLASEINRQATTDHKRAKSLADKLASLPVNEYRIEDY